MAKDDDLWRSLSLNRWGCLPRSRARDGSTYWFSFHRRLAREAEAVIFYSVICVCGVEDGVLYGGDPGDGGSGRAFTLRPSLELKLLGDTLFAKILEHR